MGWARKLRPAATIAALLFVVACVASDPVEPPSPTATSPSPTNSGSATSSASPGSRPGATVPGAVPRRAAYTDDGAVGAMARVYLRSSPASSLLVEVDWIVGREPSPAALDSLRGILARELDKSSITVRRDSPIASSRTRWTVQDLAALQRANRGFHSAGSRATMWIAYLGGSFAENENALGVAFAASSVALFADRINAATSALVSATQIERSVLVHEAGHLLALVNIGYRSRFNHEDPAHPNHSNDRGSVMYWAVEDLSIRTVLKGGPAADFDSADRADLAMLRGS